MSQSDDLLNNWVMDVSQEKIDSSPSNVEFDDAQRVEMEERQLEVNKRVSVSDLINNAPPSTQYDYGVREIESENKGQPAQPDWFENQYYKPYERVVFGHDVSTGEKIYEEFDESPEISHQVKLGMDGLRKSSTHPEDGPDPDGLTSLSRLAVSTRLSGNEDYQSFAQQVRSMGYPESAVRQSWAVGSRVMQRQQVEEYLNNPDISPEEESAVPEPPDLAVDDLYEDQNWQIASEILYQQEEGKPFQGAPEELMDWTINEMSNFNWRTFDMGYYTVQAINRGGDYAQALSYLINTYDRVETDWDIFGKSLGAAATDVTNYLGMGGGLVAGKVAMTVAKSRFKKIMNSKLGQAGVMGGTAGAVEGGIFSAAYDASRQGVDIAAGNQDEFSGKQLATATGVGIVGGTVLGGGIGMAISKPARELYGRAGRKALDNAKAGRPMPSWSSARQAGAVSLKGLPPMSLPSARATAASRNYPNQRPFKMDMQKAALAEQEKIGINLSEDTEAANAYLKKMVVDDATEALKDNANAIGWYDRTVTEAINTLSEIHPEIKTDKNAKFAFTFALANTSNGLKVNKNFELAEAAYQYFKEYGEFPVKIGIGNAGAAINKTFQLYNDMVDKYGTDYVRELFDKKTTVGDLKKAGFKVSGEWVDTEVYGSAIIGPKIGNGFYSNLNGKFDQLTMDRWLRRTWGRWTGTLIGERPDLVADKTKKMRDIVRGMTPEEKKAFKGLGVTIKTKSNEDIVATANAIQKASMLPEYRTIMNETPAGDALRKVGNGLAKDVDGQIEAPTAAERNRIRRVFTEALNELQGEYPEMTMADLQALLWYPEKRLYDGATSKEEFSHGYEDDEAPDYANAARSLADKLGFGGGGRGTGGSGGGDVPVKPKPTKPGEAKENSVTTGDEQ